SEKIDQKRDQRRVGWWHLIVAQFVRPYPFQRLMFTRLWEAPETAADEKRHQEVEVVIRVAGEGQRCKTGGLGFDAEFFVKFTHDGFFRCLTRLNFAAGKLPQAG